ncbi:DNA-binding domain-containing protein [Dyella sp. RRB7]|uniref:HvfC/BufC N-terminal domain-containing protein n=1 Tax=Dyella sp. RRB7 TaxID=2919502 RepID=UPI001FA9F8F3
MSDLRALQQQVQQAVLADQSHLPDGWPGDGLASSSDRLDVYRHGYRIRLRDALASEFPGLALMAGRRFEHLLTGYIEAHPSGHYNIRWHGAGLAAFLDYGLPWSRQPALADMARLDWAISTVFDAADEAVIAPDDLAELPGDAWVNLRLRTQGHLQLLPYECNIDAFRRAADRGMPRPHLRRYAKRRHLLVWRQALAVRYRPVADDERLALTTLIQGGTFSQLCERLSDRHGPATAMPRAAQLLHRWLDDGLIACMELS